MTWLTKDFFIKKIRSSLFIFTMLSFVIAILILTISILSNHRNAFIEFEFFASSDETWIQQNIISSDSLLMAKEANLWLFEQIDLNYILNNDLISLTCNSSHFTISLNSFAFGGDQIANDFIYALLIRTNETTGIPIILLTFNVSSNLSHFSMILITLLSFLTSNLVLNLTNLIILTITRSSYENKNN